MTGANQITSKVYSIYILYLPIEEEKAAEYIAIEKVPYIYFSFLGI